jgi:hypothetical protein
MNMPVVRLSVGCAFAFLCEMATSLPLPAVEILQGPPPGNYCQAPGVPALFNVNTRPGDTYYGRGTFTVNSVVVHQTPLGPFVFPAGVVNSTAPMPPAFTPGVVYPPGTVFSSIATYFDAAQRPTYENELAIRCDTGQTVFIRNTDLTPAPPQPVPVSPLLAFVGVALSTALLLRRRFVDHDV